jgi:hypothetical protein
MNKLVPDEGTREEVALDRLGNTAYAKISRELGVSSEAVRNCFAQRNRVGCRRGDGMTSDERAELQRPQREGWRQAQERESLREDVGWFARKSLAGRSGRRRKALRSTVPSETAPATPCRDERRYTVTTHPTSCGLRSHAGRLAVRRCHRGRLQPEARELSDGRIGRVGASRDNALAESFCAMLKNELLFTRAWPTYGAAYTGIHDYIETFYHTTRRQAALDFASPDQYQYRHATRLAA